MFLLFILSISITLFESEAYVLLQVRKQDANYSNVDALIHKKVPSEKINKLARSIGRRDDEDKSDYDDVSNTLSIPETDPAKATTREPNLLDLVGLFGKKIRKNPTRANFRARDRDDGVIFRPKRVQLNHGESSVYNVDPEKLILAMRDILSSTTLKKYIDKLSRKAAAVYRTVENDIQPLTMDFVRIFRSRPSFNK